MHSRPHRLRPQRHDLMMDRFDLRPERRVVNGQGRRLNDDHLGQLLGPSQPVLQQGRCLFGFVTTGQPEVGSERTIQQTVNETERNQHQQRPRADCYQRLSRTEAGQQPDHEATLLTPRPDPGRISALELGRDHNHQRATRYQRWLHTHEAAPPSI